MFKRIDHVEIVTDQLDRTEQFYTDVLGFTVKARDRIERSSLGVPIDLVYLDLGGTTVELIRYDGAAVDPAPQTEHLGYRMIALEVDDMQKTVDYLSTKGVDIVWGPRVRETYSSRNLRPQRLPDRASAVVPVGAGWRARVQEPPQKSICIYEGRSSRCHGRRLSGKRVAPRREPIAATRNGRVASMPPRTPFGISSCNGNAAAFAGRSRSSRTTPYG